MCTQADAWELQEDGCARAGAGLLKRNTAVGYSRWLNVVSTALLYYSQADWADFGFFFKYEDEWAPIIGLYFETTRKVFVRRIGNGFFRMSYNSTGCSLLDLTFGTGVLHLIQINHQPDATIFQFIILTFVYCSSNSSMTPPGSDIGVYYQML
jgi:hypothetical protein